MIECVSEWMRVLKSDGSLFVNLGDKYADKSLIGLPWRFAIRCMDELALTLRAEIVWSKPSAIPESVTDRVCRSHEQWFHFVQQPRYYSGIDHIRQPVSSGDATDNPLGALPRSVWQIASEPLRIPEHIAHARCCNGVKRPGCEGLDHYAAFPLETVIRIVRGWSPSGICTKCGEGRQPVTLDERIVQRDRVGEKGTRVPGQTAQGGYRGSVSRVITGEVCACTPFTQHPGSGERHANASVGFNIALQSGQRSGKPHTGPWREYHYDLWNPAPTTEAVVLDPFGGSGTVALVADVLGRHGIYNDASADYCFLAQWRTTDPGERARALRIAKPPKQLPEQISLWDIFGDLDEDADREDELTA
jgi:hypothetical protein